VTKPRRAPRPWWGHGDLATSLILIVPLLFAYEVGVLFSHTVNGADLITRAAWELCDRRRAVYLVAHAAVAIGFLIWLRRSSRARALELDVVGPLVLEAAIYALTLGAAVSIVVHDLLGLGPVLETVVSALGAGVHEELVFRLAAFMGGAALLRRTGCSPRVAWLAAFVASSLLFAAAHHVGAAGEAWRTDAFVFRAFAGGAFAAIAWYRSLAHAVYAHVLYDLYVALIR
jgi:hypothetical protein